MASLVVYNGRLYFVEIDESGFDFDSYAYADSIKSTDFEGKNEVEVHNYKSLTAFINVVGNRIYSFIQRRSDTDSNVTAFYIETMALTGGSNYYLKN